MVYKVSLVLKFIMTYPKMLESYFENVGSLHTIYIKYIMSTPGKINKTLNYFVSIHQNSNNW